MSLQYTCSLPSTIWRSINGEKVIVSVARCKCSNVILEGSLVLEVRPTVAEPKLPAVLLMGSSIALDGQELAALAARKWLHPMLPLVMSLQLAEVLEWLRARTLDVVPAPRWATMARDDTYGPGLSSPQRLWPLPILRSMSPHVHLQHKIQAAHN